MSRAARTARGMFGAIAVTLLAATSHSLADGVITPQAVVATTMVALPLCVLLAGKVGSLWRLTLAVVPAQFIYHWSFAGLGAASLQASSAGEFATSAHAAHLGLLPNFAVSELAAAGAADAVMWAAHAGSAIVTIALLYRGERAALHLLRVLRSAMPAALPVMVALPHPAAAPAPYIAPERRTSQTFLVVQRHRGPPALLLHS